MTNQLQNRLIMVLGMLLALLLVVLLLLVMNTARGSSTLAVTPAAASPNPESRILFIGNSYTGYNNLREIVSEVIERSAPDWGPVTTAAVTPGGYTFTTHQADAARSGTRLDDLLGQPWELVAMQEQSQTPGYYEDSTQKRSSLQNGARLAESIEGTGAHIMLFMTWGYQGGDATNPDIYRTYPMMQERTSAGYLDLADAFSGAIGEPVSIAPVGTAFHLIYDENRSVHRQLYAGDGSHPSLAGSYLAALVISVSYTGQPVSAISWQPSGLNNNVGAYLREVADRVVLARERPAGPFLWDE
ncbi:MAG: DUF4886 domain-containing protein [Anaerolineae bacterium]